MNLKDFAKPFSYPMKQSLKYIYGAIPPRIRYGKVFGIPIISNIFIKIVIYPY